MLRHAERAGVRVIVGRWADALVDRHTRIVGARDDVGDSHVADFHIKALHDEGTSLDPDAPRQVTAGVASGGSGHGFKFAPVLGEIIADAVEGRAHPLANKFRWRPEVRLEAGREAARKHVE